MFAAIWPEIIRCSLVKIFVETTVFMLIFFTFANSKFLEYE